MNNKGFTIIEIIIATAILSIIIASLTVALIQQQRQFNLTSESIDVDQTGRTVVDFIASELRQTGARQSKQVSINFINGGSPNCYTDPSVIDTTGYGSTSSPPDCITIYTWDLTRGQNGNDLPSVPTNPQLISQSPLTIQLPAEWFPVSDPALVTSDGHDLLGFWGRTSGCLPTSSTGTECLTNPKLCTECGAILRIDGINASNQASFGDTTTLLSDIVSQNFQLGDYTTAGSFVTDFVNNIQNQNPAMTIVTAKSFRVDTTTKELKMQIDRFNNFTSIAGGEDAPGIVDLQFVFNLFNPDDTIGEAGVPIKVGVPLDAANSEFPHFGVFGGDDLRGREKDIRSVEVTVVVRSRLKPQLISGSRVPVLTVNQVGDVLERSTNDPSLGEGYVYKIFTATVYLRNFGREEFG